MKSKFNEYHWAVLAALFVLTGIFLSCGGSSSSDDGAPAVVPAVVFIADSDLDGIKELYVALDDGDSVVLLSNGGDVRDFKISPDGSQVAFRADQDTPGVIELYVNSINGGIPVKVSGVLPPNWNVEVLPAFTSEAYGWSPDSSFIAYIAGLDDIDPANDVYELFVSTPDGLNNYNVSGTLPSGRIVREFEWAPNSSLIAYRADQNSSGVIELYATRPVAGPTPVRINTPLPAGSNLDVTAQSATTDVFAWAPNSSMISYIVMQDNFNVFELFTAELRSIVPTVFDTPPVRVHPVFTGAGDEDIKEFKWAPDSSRIAYIADQDTNGVFELYSADPAPIAAPDSIKVCAPLVALQNVEEFAWAPDSSRIAYRADQDANDVFELYTTNPFAVSDFVKVSGTLVTPGGNVDVPPLSTAKVFGWAPDNTRIAYIADQDINGVFELYSADPAPIAAPDSIKVCAPLVALQNVEEFAWAPDSSRIAYRADQNANDVFELYTTNPFAVSDFVKVSDTLVTPGGNVDVPPLSTAKVFGWAPDNSRIAYIADQEADDEFELFSSSVDGGVNQKISDPLVPNGNVLSFEYEP